MLLHLCAYSRNVSHLLDSLTNVSQLYLSNLQQVSVNVDHNVSDLISRLEQAEMNQEIKALKEELVDLFDDDIRSFRLNLPILKYPCFRRTSYKFEH